MPTKVSNSAKALRNLKARKKREELSNSINSSKLASQHNKENNNHHVDSTESALTHSINKKITDYFQIRKSSRKCKSDIEKEKREYIENLIKSMKDQDGLEVKHIENKGRGVFATRKFDRGDFVCEYAGEIISYKAAKKREELYAADSSIGCYMYFFEHKSKQYCIDATAETDRLGRLFNHSKLGGNCHTKLFEMNQKPYLILVASRDIEIGEELTYDYGERNKVAIESHPWLAQ